MGIGVGDNYRLGGRRRKVLGLPRNGWDHWQKAELPGEGKTDRALVGFFVQKAKSRVSVPNPQRLAGKSEKVDLSCEGGRPAITIPKSLNGTGSPDTRKRKAQGPREKTFRPNGMGRTLQERHWTKIADVGTRREKGLYGIQIPQKKRSRKKNQPTLMGEEKVMEIKRAPLRVKIAMRDLQRRKAGERLS